MSHQKVNFNKNSDSDEIPTKNQILSSETCWWKNQNSISFFTKTLTAFYALILTIVAFVIEISPTWISLFIPYAIFASLMYSIAVIFFIYLYFFVIYPQPFNLLIHWFNKLGFLSNPKKFFINEPIYNGEGAGTLYLRLGALLFGTLGSVLWGSEIFLCFSSEKNDPIYMAEYILAMIFTYFQIHFIFCNSKINLKQTCSNVISSFGMMHCVAVNLWIWFSLCLAKTQYKNQKKGKSNYEDSHSMHSAKQIRALYELGSVANFLLTTLVEFSLIAAAVYFIIWKCEGKEVSNDKKKKQIRFDCRSTTTGLFVGIFLQIGAFVSITISSILKTENEMIKAEKIVGISQIFLFLIILIAIFFAIFRMRHLEYRIHSHGEIIDMILLIVGLSGEIIYCSTGLEIFIFYHEKDSTISPFFMIFFVVRMIQVIIQALFILIASRLASSNQNHIKNQPGKQLITFLVICNINLFIFHIFETIGSSFGFPQNLDTNFAIMLNVSSPLVIFYRFHSSACLAEIWKHAYPTKLLLEKKTSDQSLNIL